MYSYFNENPRGKNVGDCTVRAISKATGKEWGETYLAMAIEGYLEGDMPSANAVWGCVSSADRLQAVHGAGYLPGLLHSR